MHRDPERAVLADKTVRDLAHLGLCHFGVSLVLEMQDPLSAASAAHRAEEDDHAAELVVANKSERVVDRERRLTHRDRRQRARVATRYRRYQRQLVAVGERLVDADVLAVARDDDPSSPGDKGGVFDDATEPP